MLGSNHTKGAGPMMLSGIAASPGLAVGVVVQLRREEIAADPTPAGDPAHERALLEAAIAAAREQIGQLHQQMRIEGDQVQADIFEAHAEIVADKALVRAAGKAIDEGASAAWGWQQAVRTYAEKLAGMESQVFADRAVDVRDVGHRVLGELTGHRDQAAQLPQAAILLAEELTPSDTAQLDRTKVVGFATTTGGASSHVAIIARSLDIPAVAGVDAAALDLAEGSTVVLDGSQGTLRAHLTPDELRQVTRRQGELARRRLAHLQQALEAAVTTDGHRVEVAANIANLADARRCLDFGAEGVGLLRSEFLFLHRTEAPSEDEQAQVYADIARALLPGMPLVIRTLDVGGDKPLPYLPIPREENPFLGIRGVRLSLEAPDVMRGQLRAILRAADAGADLQVMLPMVTTLEDFREARRLFDEVSVELGIADVPLGIMVEVPAVALMAEQFAREVDFFSVGTNDLTSYTLAMDRGHSKLAPQVDHANPAVLSMVALTAQAARKYGRKVAVCGGMASDPQTIPLLVGLGVDELSCAIPAIPGAKAQVRSRSLEECRELAERALLASTAAEVRALVPIEG